MIFQAGRNEDTNRRETKKKNLDLEIRPLWLGVRDSNPRMPGPKPGALPLGEPPIIGLGASL